jgi:hypothetical protein
MREEQERKVATKEMKEGGMKVRKKGEREGK